MTFSLDQLLRFRQSGTSLNFLYLFTAFKDEPAAVRLRRLVRLVDEGRLVPQIGLEADWREVSNVALALFERQFVGKAVLHVSA